MKNRWMKRGMKRLGRKQQLGVSFVELTIGLAVITVLAAATAGIGYGLFGDSKETIETQNMTMILSKVPKLKDTDGYGTSGTNLVPRLAEIGLPKNMSYNSSTSTLTNSWGGSVTIVSTGAGFEVTSTTVPKAACISMAQSMSKGGAVTTQAGSSGVVTGVVTNAVASAGCSSDSSNTLVFGVTS